MIKGIGAMNISQETRRRLRAGTAWAAVMLMAGSAGAQEAVRKRNQADEQQQTSATFLDAITISSTQVRQAVIEAMAGISYVGTDELQRIQANTAADLFRTVPGVAASMNGDDPATAVNIRGLEQYGRVVVTLDGARQDYWRVGHGSGSFYIEPELIRDVTVIRGPVSNSYGSGGIGGVVSFETKDAGDFLRAGETWALSEKLAYESNGDGFTTTTTGAYRFNADLDVIGSLTWRDRNAYEDGNGDTVPWTGETVKSGYFKGTFRPTDDQELKLGAILQRYDDYITGSSGSTSATLSRYDAKTTNETYTASYTWNPDDLIDFSVNLYHNDTRAEQTQVWPRASIGNFRYYDVSTTGMTIKNSSRFQAANFDHTLTYGGDFYYLKGDSDAAHFGSGRQRAWGGFVQWQGDHENWLQLIAAMRYDGYSLDGQTKEKPPRDASMDGSRWSPRITVGVTPVEGAQFYTTWSEGYRAPMLQDVYRGGGAHGAGDSYVPNLLLRPEVAKSWETGVNLKYDAVFNADDQLRAKINFFHTRVDDYIDVDLTTLPRTASNIGNARMRGIEIEGGYDFAWGFINASGSIMDAEMTSGIYRGQTLSNTPLDRASATLGFRALEDALSYGVQFQHIGSVIRTSHSNPAAAPVKNDGYNLVNLFADWKVNDNMRLGLGVDNVFDVSYTDPQSAWSTTAATEQGRGRTFRISLTGRIGG